MTGTRRTWASARTPGGHMSGSRSPSAWWTLLVLPIALFVGLFVGRTPALDRAPTPPEPPARPKRVARANVAATQGATLRNSVEAADRQTVEGTPPPPVVVSSWTSYDAALDESRRTGKAVLLDFNADWCPPCRALKRELFDDYTGGQAVCAAVVPVSLVDRIRETGANPPDLDILQRRFGVDAFPTLVVFSPSTGREQRLQGYAGREATLRWITQAAAAVR